MITFIFGFVSCLVLQALIKLNNPLEKLQRELEDYQSPYMQRATEIIRTMNGRI